MLTKQLDASLLCLFGLFISYLSSSLFNAGAQVFPNLTVGWVDVKDVAKAHIQAYEIPSASGRYCMVGKVAHYSEVVRTLRELYPSLQLPKK
jgi:nucleoside-diphosphate-sugar epimerase